MKNHGNGGDEGASSNSPSPVKNNLVPPPTEASLPHQSSGDGSPRGGIITSAARGLAGELTPPPQNSPPVMGVAGQSAFSPYTRPRTPAIGGAGRSAFSPYTRPAPAVGRGPSAFTPYKRPLHADVQASGSAKGAGTSGGLGFGDVAQTVPVGGGGTDVVASGALRIGGSPARKRDREGGAGSSAPAGGNQPIDAPRNAVHCSLCGKEFLTPKALFGHMRLHPDRGWRGARPPPTFNAQEEFADLRAEGQAAAGAVGGARNVGSAEDGGKRAEEHGAGEADGEEYSLPDLNNPPPADSN